MIICFSPKDDRFYMRHLPISSSLSIERQRSESTLECNTDYVIDNAEKTYNRIFFMFEWQKKDVRSVLEYNPEYIKFVINLCNNRNCIINPESISSILE
jgi:hypothetical protein